MDSFEFVRTDKHFMQWRVAKESDDRIFIEVKAEGCWQQPTPGVEGDSLVAIRALMTALDEAIFKMLTCLGFRGCRGVR